MSELALPPPPAPPPSAPAPVAVRPAGSRSVIRFDTAVELLALAGILYKGGLTPPGIDRPEKLAVLILAGAEVGLTPTQAVAGVYVTNGRATLFGDVGGALVRASGLLEHQVESVAGDGDARAATVRIKRRGYPEATFTFSVAQAQRLKSYQAAQDPKKGGPWKDDPDNMLTWRARWKAWRAEFPDVLRGMTGAEEEEPVTVEAAPVVRPAPVVEPAAEANAEPPATKEQLLEIKRLKELADGTRTDEAGRKDLWAEFLAPYRVATARDLTAAQAAELIDAVGKLHDPFGHPQPPY